MADFEHNPWLLKLGVDAKITPSGEVGIVEVNGRNSGLAGMCLLGDARVRRNTEARLSLSYLAGFEDSLESHLLRNGEDTGLIQSAIRLSCLNASTIECSRFVGHESCKDERERLAFTYIINKLRHYCFYLSAHVSEDQSGFPILSRYGIATLGFSDGKFIFVVDKNSAEFKEVLRKILIDLESTDSADVSILKNNIHVIDLDVPDEELYAHGEYNFMPQHPAQVEHNLGDKSLTKPFIPPENQPPYMIWAGSDSEVDRFVGTLFADNPSRLIDTSRAPFVVVKKFTGAHGDNVKVVDVSSPQGLKDLKQYLQTLPPNQFLIEGYIYTDGVLIDNRRHDYCARVLLLFGVGFTGMQSCEMLFQTGYYRAAPKPWDTASQDPNMACKANLTSKERDGRAIPMPIPDDALRQIANVGHQIACNLVSN